MAAKIGYNLLLAKYLNLLLARKKFLRFRKSILN